MTERELLKLFGANIKLHRNRCQWSQAELAEIVDISVNFLSDIETGKKWASPVTMVKFAETFKIYAYELLKPVNLPPDSGAEVIEKYTAEVYAALAKVHDGFVKRLPGSP